MSRRPRSRAAALLRATSAAGSAAAVALTAHSLLNLRDLRRPPIEPPPVTERVSLLLPVRDEGHQVAGTLAAMLDQICVPDLEIIVLDDGSSDDTVAQVRRATAGDPRVTLLTGTPPPPGWLGKTHACRQLADAATGRVLAFVDADVRLAPQAVAAAVHVLRTAELDLVSPYPRQLAETIGERLVQPLLQWSWATTLPLRRAERSPRPSLSAANGQFLVVDAAAYHRAGGHVAVRDQVLDDLALLRAVKRSGGTGGVVDGTDLAVCRMYTSWPQVRDGYAKSLWSAFGPPVAAGAVLAGLGAIYVVPPVAALCGVRSGWVGYAAGALGRYVIAERTGGRSVPDSFTHPLSVLALTYLTARSWWGHRNSTLYWKGRPL